MRIGKRFAETAIAITAAVLIAIGSNAKADDCTPPNPPKGYGPSWWSAYSSWCARCGGTPNQSSQSCTPGANWGGASGGYNWQLQRDEQQRKSREEQQRHQIEGERNRRSEEQRQEAEEERRRKEEEERKRIEAESVRQRKEEFEKGKQDALKLLKGFDSGDFDLKGFDTGNDFSFKEIGDSGLKDIQSDKMHKDTKNDSSPNQDSSVVDLSHLDSHKPITVDPNIVRGKERQIPAQVSDKTLNNENYKRGYKSILAGNHSEALDYFEKAEAELPVNDILVKNAIGLADALAKKQTLAGEEAKKGLREALDGNYDNAIRHLESACKMDPKDNTFRESLESVQEIKKGVLSIGSQYAKESPEKTRGEKAQKLAELSLGAIYRKDYNTAIIILEAAQSINPSDKNISFYIEMVRGFRHGGNKQ